MNAPAPAPSGLVPTRPSAPAAPVRRGGPTREGPLARALRWIEDRRRLSELDGHLLRDLGLTREDVRCGVPFVPLAPVRPVPSSPAPAGTASGCREGMARLGTLEAHGWPVSVVSAVITAHFLLGATRAGALLTASGPLGWAFAEAPRQIFLAAAAVQSASAGTWCCSVGDAPVARAGTAPRRGGPFDGAAGFSPHPAAAARARRPSPRGPPRPAR